MDIADHLEVVDDPVGAAELSAGALRAVNCLTLAPSSARTGWSEIGDIYRVIGELQVLLDRLPHAFEQLARHAPCLVMGIARSLLASLSTSGRSSEAWMLKKSTPISAQDGRPGHAEPLSHLCRREQLHSS